MYRQGLTPQRIANLCGVPLSRVNRALGWSKRRDPYLVSQHADHSGPGMQKISPSVSARWRARHDELLRFIGSTGRMPFTKVPDPVEASLGRWLARQRYALLSGKLDDERERRLDEAGSWKQSARSQRDTAGWQDCLNDLAAFMITSDRLPSYRNYTDEAERRLGVWLHAQRQRAVNGNMPDQMLAALDEAVPGWNTWKMRK